MTMVARNLPLKMNITERASGRIRCLFDEKVIAERVDQLALEIAGQMPPDLLVVAVLRGSFIFAADLIRAMHRVGLQPQVDFITLSSYGLAKSSSGKVNLVRDLSDPVDGRHILLIEDMVESGLTLVAAKSHLSKLGAASVKVCALLDKAGSRQVPIDPDFVGFACPPEFVIGYGLDQAGYYRELPFIGVLEEG